MKWTRKICQGLAYYDTSPTQAESKVQPNTLVKPLAQRPALVFIHGVGLRAESWYQQLNFFSTHYRCYAVDMPGHGESPCLDKANLQLTDFASALTDFIDTVTDQPVILIGHSLGAMTALQTAISYQQHSKLVKSSSTASVNTDSNSNSDNPPNKLCAVVALNAIYQRPETAAQKVQQRADSLLNDIQQNVSDSPIQRWFANEPNYQTQAELCRHWLDTGSHLGYAKAYQMFAHLRGIDAADLAQIDIPTLFITGEEDANSSPQMSLAMADIVPHAKAVIIPHARHMAQMTHADAVNRALANFIAGCQGNCD
ncbi:alpha/beta fold hydrolase [Psychrobacter lutiphocae]|uniref:alpha/beta fold hydrolase n=1 Tax=Psychrobacter lutiphocae TaxID=540500 RepID=UPI00038189E3|nr:alpha/beta hydrolase [Psychrobacter lutiphocae]